MKKKYLALIMTMMAAFLMPKATAMAGDINGAEQGILDALSNTYEYDGGYYKVTDGYIAQVSDYLCKDEVNLTSEEASGYLAQFYANIGTGIASGYMVKVGDVEQPSGGQTAQPEQGQSEQEQQNDAENSSESGENTETAGTEGESAGNTGVSDKKNDSTVATVQPQEKTENKPITDNTTGSTQSGKVEYSVTKMEAVMYVWDVESLDVHAEAYKDSEVLGTLQKGDRVQVTGAATTGWAQIWYQDEVGYVSAAYLRTESYVQSQIEEEEENTQSISENETQEETDSHTEEAAEEPQKDYSDADTPARGVNMEWIAVLTMAVLIVAAVVVVMWHRRKK